jgi:polyisoprenoid-binding protein YceI
MKSLRAFVLMLVAAMLSAGAHAAPVIFDIDSSHTYPSFEADHMGLSTWRGKFNLTQGQVLLDREAAQGSLDIVVDITSVDFGHDLMNKVALGESIFDAEKHPHARYKGRLVSFVDGAPTKVEGDLTLHGVTRPLTLTIQRFKCMPHPLHKRELCGADALARLNRADFGIDAGKAYGFDMNVVLRIQVEAVAKP